MDINKVFSLIHSYNINHVDLKQEDLAAYNQALKDFDSAVQIEAGQYLAKIDRIRQKYNHCYRKDINTMVFDEKSQTFLKNDLTYDEQIYILNIQKRYEIGLQKQIIEQGSSPFIIYFDNPQQFPDNVSKNSYFFLQWFLFREFMKFDANDGVIPFFNIKIPLLFFINEAMLKQHLEKYKEFILHYPTMDSDQGTVIEEQNKLFFEQKTIELCYMLSIISDGKREDIIPLVQLIINELKQYQTIVVNIILYAIQYFLTTLDMKQHNVEIDIPKDLIQIIIGEKCNPNKSILFKSMKQKNQGDFYIKYQNQNYNNFMNNFYIWSIFENYQQLISQFLK